MVEILDKERSLMSNIKEIEDITQVFLCDIFTIRNDRVLTVNVIDEKVRNRKKHLDESITTLIEQEILKARVDTHKEYAVGGICGYELYADARIRELESKEGK